MVTCREDVIGVRRPRRKSSRQGMGAKSHPLGTNGFQSSGWKIAYNRRP
jgi:hypothetical protein